jgi:uncharacterized protein (DUF58 family)
VRRPGKKTFIVVGVVALLVLAGASAQAGWLFVLAAGVAGLVGGSLLVPQRLRSFSVERSVPPGTIAGHEVLVTLTVRNPSSRGLPLARIEDRFPGLEPASYVCEPTPPGGTSESRLLRKATKRGVFEGGEVRITSGTPFGFVTASRTLQVASRLVVVPRWVELTSFPILEPASSPRDVLHERARTGAGEEYLGVRPYRPGDPRRFVHWRSSARAGSLVVREYEEHVRSAVSVVVAGADFGEPPDSAFEALVSGAASIGNYALATGHPIQIVMAGKEEVRRLVRPGRNEMLEWLAEAEARDVPLGPLVAAASGSVGPRGTVVVMVTSGGRAEADLRNALATIERAGQRGVALVADAQSWSDPASASVPEVIHDAPGTARRSTIRSIRKGEDLRACLQV